MILNLFTDLPNQLPIEHVTTLIEAVNIRIERIVSHGHASPEGFWYDQEQHEWVVVLKGEARNGFEGGFDKQRAGNGGRRVPKALCNFWRSWAAGRVRCSLSGSFATRLRKHCS